MPRRKSKSAVASRAINVPILLAPISPICDKKTMPVATKTISRAKAIELLSQDGYFLVEDPLSLLTHELCLNTILAYGIVPDYVKAVVVSNIRELPDDVRERSSLFELRSDSEMLACTGRIHEVLSSFSKRQQQLDYSGHIKKSSMITIMQCGIAATILNISHLGRGLPTGSHWQHSIRYFIEHPGSTAQIVESISDGNLRLSELLLANIPMPDWRKNTLIQNHVYTNPVPNAHNQLRENLHSFLPHYYAELANDTKHDDLNSQASMLCREYAELQFKLWDVVKILKSYTSLLTLQEEESLPTAIALQDDFADKCLEAFRFTGAENAVLAYFDGVPLADVLA